MKTIAIIILLSMPLSWTFSQKLKPYVKAFETTESVSDIKTVIQKNFELNGINVVGQYQPANDKSRWVIVFSSPELVSAVKKIGGLTGFAATLRVGITYENGKTIVSYTNPAYWGNAYFRDDFDKVLTNYTLLSNNIIRAMKASGTFIGKPFGSKEGLTTNELQEYHYMMGMPYFDDTVELEDFDSYKAALAKIELSIKKGVPNIKMIYKLAIPNKALTLYGFALSGEDGEGTFLPIIDVSNPKHTAFLPYEVLVMGDEVHILHGRFRIAIAFPDLTMGTFSKIMATPGDIEDLLEQLVE